MSCATHFHLQWKQLWEVSLSFLFNMMYFTAEMRDALCFVIASALNWKPCFRSSLENSWLVFIIWLICIWERNPVVSFRLFIILSDCVMYCHYCLYRGILYPRVHALHLDRPMDAGPWPLQAVARDGLSALYCLRLQHSLNQLRPLPVCHQSCTY